jgi:hypothetical protein
VGAKACAKPALDASGCAGGRSQAFASVQWRAPFWRPAWHAPCPLARQSKKRNKQFHHIYSSPYSSLLQLAFVVGGEVMAAIKVLAGKSRGLGQTSAAMSQEMGPAEMRFQPKGAVKLPTPPGEHALDFLLAFGHCWGLWNCTIQTEMVQSSEINTRTNHVERRPTRICMHDSIPTSTHCNGFCAMRVCIS